MRDPLLARVHLFSPELLAVSVMAAAPQEQEWLAELGMDAFSTLVAQFEDEAVYFVECSLRRHGCPVNDDAFEIVSSAFLRLWRVGLCRGAFDPGRGSVRSYFYTIVRHQTASFLRAKGRRAKPPPPETVDPRLDVFVDREEVTAVINMLPAADKEMLLFILADFTTEEICDATGLETSQVYRRTFRARSHFRRLWVERQRRLDDVCWLEALCNQEEAARVIARLCRQDQQVLRALLAGDSIDEISAATRLSRKEVFARIFAAKDRFGRLWDQQTQRDLASL